MPLNLLMDHVCTTCYIHGGGAGAGRFSGDISFQKLAFALGIANILVEDIFGHPQQSIPLE